MNAPAAPAAFAPAGHADPDFDDEEVIPAERAFPPGRQDGWTPTRQRNFLTFLAEGHTVELACRCVGLTVSSAYALRRRACGAAFALGWQAAGLLARDTIADALATRAIDGQVETITRADGSIVTRHRFDNRLAMSMLLRLDRQADAGAGEASHHAARLVASDWEAYLAGIERDPGPARAGLFLGLRAEAAADAVAAGPDVGPIVALARADRFVRTGAAVLAELDADDLDPARRAEWSAADWARAEAAGLVALAPPPPAPCVAPVAAAAAVDDAADMREAPPLPPLPPGPPLRSDQSGPVWWDTDEREWRTWFPPPEDFEDCEDGTPDADHYARALTPDELDTLEAARDALVEESVDPAVVERDAWFASLAARTAAARMSVAGAAGAVVVDAVAVTVDVRDVAGPPGLPGDEGADDGGEAVGDDGG